MSWRILHERPVADVRLAAGFLDGFGVPLRIVDTTGAEVARETVASTSDGLAIEVRAEDAAFARELLADARPGPIPRSDRALDRLGLSIRGCAMSTFFAPLGVILAPAYLKRAARADERPSEHGWTLAGIAVCVVLTACWVGVWAMG